MHTVLWGDLILFLAQICISRCKALMLETSNILRNFVYEHTFTAYWYSILLFYTVLRVPIQQKRNKQ